MIKCYEPLALSFHSCLSSTVGGMSASLKQDSKFIQHHLFYWDHVRGVIISNGVKYYWPWLDNPIGLQDVQIYWHWPYAGKKCFVGKVTHIKPILFNKILFHGIVRFRICYSEGIYFKLLNYLPVIWNAFRQ